jgi:3-hydroxyisobutyrate dehydrogenase-like beta-hydroxyacid dehydrogenase
MTTIGFIGLGNMGAAMAANLVGAGHHVTGFDLMPRAMETLATKGGHAAASAAEAAAAGDIVITCSRPVRRCARSITAAMMLKELRLAQQAASATATPLGAAAASLYQMFVDGGAGVLDFSGIYRLIGKSDPNM